MNSRGERNLLQTESNGKESHVSLFKNGGGGEGGEETEGGNGTYLMAVALCGLKEMGVLSPNIQDGTPKDCKRAPSTRSAQVLGLSSRGHFGCLATKERARSIEQGGALTQTTPPVTCRSPWNMLGTHLAVARQPKTDPAPCVKMAKEGQEGTTKSI
ncbi:UNVERIFIED_CONTAM: hypothetical protein K2H54_035008 [Gekko kuhli]